MALPADQPALRRSASHLVWITGLTGAVIALAGNLVILLLARLIGAAMTTSGSGPVGVVQIIPATVFVFAAGTLILWLVHRRGARAWTVLAIVGAVFGVLSLAGPAALAATSGTLIALAAMHLLSTATWVVTILRGRRAVAAIPA